MFEQDDKTKGGALHCTLFFRSMTRPKTFLQCFALEQRKYKAKHCRNVLGQKNKIQIRSLRHANPKYKSKQNFFRWFWGWKEKFYLLCNFCLESRMYHTYY